MDIYVVASVVVINLVVALLVRFIVGRLFRRFRLGTRTWKIFAIGSK